MRTRPRLAEAAPRSRQPWRSGRGPAHPHTPSHATTNRHAGLVDGEFCCTMQYPPDRHTPDRGTRVADLKWWATFHQHAWAHRPPYKEASAPSLPAKARTHLEAYGWEQDVGEACCQLRPQRLPALQGVPPALDVALAGERPMLEPPWAASMLHCGCPQIRPIRTPSPMPRPTP